MEDHFLVFKIVYKTGEDLEVFTFTARCPGCMSLLKGTARQAHTEKLPKADCRVVERHFECGEAAQRRVKGHQDRAVERRTHRTKSSPEEGQTDAPTTTTIIQSKEAPF